MGALDSPEACELVGLFLLSNLERLIPKDQIGLYRNDGLAVVELSGSEVGRLKKKVVKLFSEHNLRITTEVNIKDTDFLDVVFILQTGLTDPSRRRPATPSMCTRTQTTP